jgi:small-conductance mechanosensitive channel
LITDAFYDALRSTGHLLVDFAVFVLTAAVYILLAYAASRLIIKLARNSRSLNKYGRNGEMIVLRMVTIGAYGIAVVAFLARMGANTTGILTLLSAFTVAIGLSLQDVLKNFFSGLFMLAEKPFVVGDRVVVRSQEGTVQGIDIRTTMLRTDDGSLLMVPNSMLFTEILRNESRYNVRIVRYTVSSGLPATEIKATLEQVASSVEGLQPSAEPPKLVRHEEAITTWEVSFSVNRKQLGKEVDIAAALLSALPDATIERVMPS